MCEIFLQVSIYTCVMICSHHDRTIPMSMYMKKPWWFKLTMLFIASSFNDWTKFCVFQFSKVVKSQPRSYLWTQYILTNLTIGYPKQVFLQLSTNGSWPQMHHISMMEWIINHQTKSTLINSTSEIIVHG